MAQQDYSKMVQDFFGAFPVDMTAGQDAFKSAAAFNEKLSAVALNAAEKSTEISTKWTKDTLAKVGSVTKAQAEPGDYSKVVTDFASAASEMTSESMAAYAEIAKKVQMDTVELLMAAGKDAGEDFTAAAKKATDDVTKAAKKASKAA
jgi:hypothetical protein